ncbi:MAG: tetratricopeptide repeat protein [Alphaproteobacteria bacterium]
MQKVFILFALFLLVVAPARAEETLTPNEINARALKSRADKGDAEAQYLLGGYYAKGIGVKQDWAQAATWSRKSAEKGNASGQYALGFLTETGRGVKRDDTEAAKWYVKAAKQGDTAAQYALADLYGRGAGVQQNWQAAYFWSSLSAYTGEDAPRKLAQDTAKHLTPEQVAALDERVNAWKPVRTVAAAPEKPKAKKKPAKKKSAKKTSKKKKPK